MITKLSFVLATLIAALALPAMGWAQESDEGKFEFKWSCASCHGLDGKGKGPLSSSLQVSPPDLTTLAKKNNGVFPVRTVFDVIDGRKVVAAHGSREMPTFGAFVSGDLYPTDRLINPSYDPGATARSRMLAIIDYLIRIQQK